MSEQSQIQFYHSYWVQNDTAQFVSHTSQKKKPSVADDCLQLRARAFFNDFWIFQLFSKITQMACTSAGNVVSGSNWSHDHTYSQADTAETINENSDHWARFRSGTDVPYHRVSIDTIFHMQSKTLVHSAELPSSLFSATVHQLTLIGIVQGNVIPTSQ